VDEKDFLARQFEDNRGHLRSVAYRMLGSLPEAEDAVQEAWLRLSRAEVGGIDNLGGWLTTVVARVCLDALRSRKSRREEPLDFHVPDPVVEREGGSGGGDPAQQALLADSIGLALLVVLETLAPAERLAFVLHDMFAVPFEEIGSIVGRTPTAARQLASRARRRVQDAPAATDRDLPRQREMVNAFLAASRAGDFNALVSLLDPDVVLRADRGEAPGSRHLQGAENVANSALLFGKSAAPARVERPALVNGAAGIVGFIDGKPFSVLGFTFTGGKIAEIFILADPARLAKLDLTFLDQ
jgi:RNA polymerase sigma-70 factor, ECF subfamily